MSEFKCRASAVSKIMTNGRGKDTAGQTALSYVQSWAVQQVTGKSAPMRTKYTEKGILVEDDAIQFACDFFNWGFADKNERYFETAHFTGTPDIIQGDFIVDIKSSWSKDTFPYFADIDKGYEMQLQVYMALTGLERAELIYVLMNAPTHLIEREANAMARELGEEEVTQEIWETCMDRMTYDHMPARLRIKRYNVERDDELIDAMKARVELLRPFAEECILTLNNFNL